MNAMLAAFGLSGGELMVILAALLIVGLVLIGLEALAFLIIRTISSSQSPTAGKQRK
jgi:hypothetical protein